MGASQQLMQNKKLRAAKTSPCGTAFCDATWKRKDVLLNFASRRAQAGRDLASGKWRRGACSWKTGALDPARGHELGDALARMKGAGFRRVLRHADDPGHFGDGLIVIIDEVENLAVRGR